MRNVAIFTAIVSFSIVGCASTVRTAPTYSDSIKQIKTIAVMPSDIKVYKITAGGIEELMDEWSDTAKQNAKVALQTYLIKQNNYQIKFIDEKWLKAEHKDLWKFNRALYNAVSNSALSHTYTMDNAFSTKVKNFDYTLGSDVQELAKVCEADALLFIYGFDYQATTGRVVAWLWNSVLGVSYQLSPSGMMVGLVNGQTGNLEWFNVHLPQGDDTYDYQNQKHMDAVVAWLTKDFGKVKEK